MSKVFVFRKEECSGVGREENLLSEWGAQKLCEAKP